MYPQGMLDSLASAPGKPAFEHGDRVVTRAELLDLVGRRISALRNVGITAGTGVGITTAVTPEAFALHLAALCVGARVLGLRPGLTAAQLPHVVDGLAAVVVDETTATPELLAAAPRILHLADLVGAYEQPRAHGRAEDVAVLVLTSGSTGTPKCAAMTYGALSTQWSWHPRTWDARTAAFGAKFRRFLLFGTLTSAVVQDFLGICLSAGGTAVIPVGLPDFPADFARLRPTASLLTVPRLHHVLDSLRTRPVDLSSLEALVVAGSPLTAHRLTEAYELIGPAVHHAYGQTELGLITVLTHADVLAHPEAAHSVGRVWPGVGLEVREGGEIWVRAPYQTAGYWRDARETAEILHEGWLRTRDLGRVDENGFLYLTGRARDIVIVNAIVHYAGAIEAALTAHPAVDQAYVVSTPDERTGEAAHAFVVPVRGASVDLDSLRAEVRTRLGPSAVPAGITMINEVPVTPAGKPDKKALVRLRTGAPARSAG